MKKACKSTLFRSVAGIHVDVGIYCQKWITGWIHENGFFTRLCCELGRKIADASYKTAIYGDVFEPK
ncbi:hypothetical protein JZU61_04195 [bacterium]|nr:hypothetical protein [bacterium]MBV5348841.1 hypothetical protein [bacterium]